MYVTINAIKNIVRYKKRYLISGIFLIVVFAVFVFAVSNYFVMYKSNKDLKENYTRWMHFRFRDELQYLSDRNLHSESQGNISEPERNFNDDVMRQYDYIINVECDYFDQFAGVEYVSDYQLGYMEIVYGTAYDYDPSTNELYNKPITKQFALYGGAIDAYERYQNEFIFSGILNYQIIDGKMYENGECLIHKLVAEENNYNIGDKLIFYDENRNELCDLTISGIYNIYQTYENIYLNSSFQSMLTGELDLQYKGLHFGSTPYNRITYHKGIKQKHVVFTDFDTVYNLYGVKSHEFDKYVAWYQLDNIYNFDEFKEDALTYKYDKNLGFYQEEQVYKIYTRFAIDIIESSKIFGLGTIPIIILIFIIIIIFMIRERKHEFFIMYSLGCRKNKLILSISVEMSFYLIIISILSVPASWLITPLSKLFYFYKESVYLIPSEMWLGLLCIILLLSLISIFITSIYFKINKKWSV